METIARWLGWLGTAAAFILPLRRALGQIKGVENAQRCLLRSRITEIYYKHYLNAEPYLREYERKDLDDLYQGYKALKGNHYVDDIYRQMRTWRVIT